METREAIETAINIIGKNEFSTSEISEKISSFEDFKELNMETIKRRVDGFMNKNSKRKDGLYAPSLNKKGGRQRGTYNLVKKRKPNDIIKVDKINTLKPKKTITLILSILMLMQSCFTMQHIPIEADLKRDYRGSYVEDIEYDFGEPDEVWETRNGYEYIYLYNEKIYKKGYKTMQTRFAFDKSDKVRMVSSNKVEMQRKFSVGTTIFAIIVSEIILGVIIGVSIAV